MQKSEYGVNYSGFDKVTHTFLDIVDLINSDISYDQILLHIINKIHQLISFHRAIIYQIDRTKISIIATIDFLQNYNNSNYSFSLNESNFLRKIIELENPYSIQDIQIDKSFIDPDEKELSYIDQIHSKMGVPIIVSGKLIGVLCFESKEIDLYQSSHIFLAISFASFIAIAIKNHLLKEAQKKKILELECIKTVFDAMNRSIELDKLCVLLGESVLKLFKCDVVYIGYLDKDKEKIFTPYFSIYGKNETVEPMNLGEGLTSIVIKSKKPLIINSSNGEDIVRLGGKIIKGVPPKSWVGVPLIAKDEAIGIISIQQYDTENYFSNEDINLLEILANSISSAIEKAYLFNETKKRETETKVIYQISRQITSFLDLNLIIQKIIEIVFPAISHTTAAIYLKRDDGLFYAVAAIGKDSEVLYKDKIIPSQGIVGKCITSKKLIIENDLAKNLDAIQVEGTEEGSENEKLMAIPLLINNIVEGVLLIWRSENEDKFNIHDQEFAESISTSISIALQNSRLYEKLNEAKKEAEYANLMKTQFLSNMSHELRTPLNSIINFSFLIQKTLPEAEYPEEYDMLRRIEDSGRYLLSLINDILDLAKIESGRMELYKEFFNITEILGSILSNTQALLTHKPVSLLTDIEQSLPLIYADKTRIRQILFNLLSNAVKFTKEGFIKLIIKLNDEQNFLFCVEDTGIGIKKEDIEKIFMEFIQIDGGINRETKGTGLGLPIAKKFIRLHGGNIWVESEFGKGSSFYFTIPFVKNLETIEQNLNNINVNNYVDSNKTEKNDKKNNILIIDDETDFVRFIDNELNKRWKIVSTTEPDEVFELIDKYKPELIFLDLIMPEIDGWSILKRLKSDEKYNNISVIVCSILNDPLYAKELKADGYITKPTEKSQLKKIFDTISLKNDEGTILIIDDDKNNIDILTSFITEKMYNIISAKNSKEGIKKISEVNENQIVILDLMLPDSDGFELLKKLEKKKIKLPNIIIISNRDLTNLEKDYIKKKGIEYIRKDQFSKDNFLHLIKRNNKN